MKLLKSLKLADYFTIGNFVSGILAILFAFEFKLLLASVMLIAAFIFDALDGRVARATKKANNFGKELDSLADLTSFGVAPVIFGFAAGLDSIASMVVLVFFATCGMLRLARFNVLKVKDFIGLPITTNGLLFPLLYLFLGNFQWYITIVYLIVGILMISDFKVKKL